MINKRIASAWGRPQGIYPFHQGSLFAIRLSLSVAAVMAMGVAGTAAYASAVNFIEVQQEGTAGVTAGLGQVAGLALSPDGQYLYSAGTGDNAIGVFQRDPTTGRLIFLQARTNGEQLPDDLGPVSGLTRPVQVRASPDGQWIYTISLDSGSVDVFSRDTATGLLSFEQRVNSADLASARAIAVSPDGNSVYVAGDDTTAQPSLVAFSTTGLNGRLSQVAAYKEGVNGISGLSVALDIVVSPDGDNVYVSGSADDAVAEFSRDTGSGTLTFMAAVKDGLNGVTGMQQPAHLAMDAAGDDLYVAASDSGAVVVFKRGGGTGALSFVEALTNNQNDNLGNTITGLSGVYSIAVSPEGSQVYTGSNGDSALAVFRRDPSTGRLTVADVLKNNQNGVGGLGNPIDLAVSPGGDSLYTAANQNNVYQVGVFGIVSADLNLVMTADATVLNLGQIIQYSIVVTNNGPSAASHATVNDILPGGLNITSGTPSQGTCTLSDVGTVACSLGALTTDAHAIITVAAAVTTTAQLTNSAHAAADQRDPRPDNNTDSVTLTANTPPTAVDNSAVTNPDTPVVINVLTNDSDADGDALSVSSYDAASAQGGTVSLNGDNTLTYTPPSGYVGKDSFHYTVTDGRGGTTSAMVTVMVNTPPTSVDDSATTTTDTPVTIYVLVNDHDDNGDAITISAVGNPSAKGGQVTDNSNGTIQYTPPSGFTGADSFTYTIADTHGATATATVSVQVDAATPVTPSGAGTGDTGGGDAGANGGGGTMDSISLAMAACMLLLAKWRRRG